MCKMGSWGVGAGEGSWSEGSWLGRRRNGKSKGDLGLGSEQRQRACYCNLKHLLYYL